MVITVGVSRTTERVFALSHLISRMTDVAKGRMLLSSPSPSVAASTLVGCRDSAAFRVKDALDDKSVVAFLLGTVRDRRVAVADSMTATATMRAFGIDGKNQTVVDIRMELAMLTMRWLSLLSPAAREDFHGAMFRHSAGLYFLRMFNLRGLRNTTASGATCVQEWKTDVWSTWTVPNEFTRDALCKWKATLEALDPSVCSNFDYVVAIPDSRRITGDVVGVPVLPTYSGMLPGEGMCVAVLLARLALQTPHTLPSVRHTDIASVCLYVRLSSTVQNLAPPPMVCPFSRK